jgi:hypothetical protein
MAKVDPVADACEQRMRLFGAIGQVEPYVLTNIMNPTLMGGPRWPALRQGFAVIRRKVRRGFRRRSHTLIASHGLSDPFDDGSGDSGLGFELILEADEDIPFDEVKNHWGFWVLYDMSQTMAAVRGGDALELLQQYGTLSAEVRNVDLPQAFQSPKGRAGVILGVPGWKLPMSLALPLGDVRLITVKLLFASELALIVREGEEGRRKLVDKFSSDGTHHLSSITRKSLV